MSDSFDVQIDKLLAHADQVLAMANDARTAASTAQAALSSDSFGLIGAFLAALLLQATTEAREGLMKAAQTMSDVNKGLQTTAHTYQATDLRHASFMRSIKKEAE
jgi:hypothetical protein